MKFTLRLCCSSVCLIITIFQHKSWGQDKRDFFSGTLTYKVSICDTALTKYIPNRVMRVVTNDTLTRIENDTDRLGKQVIIKHMTLNKSYLLLQTPAGKFAIQTDHNKQKKDSSHYAFKNICGKKSFGGLKAKKTLVSHKGFTTPMTFYYIKNLSPKYLNTFENAPGLPVLYYIPTEDGIYKYELISFERTPPEHNLFGIPSDYKRVTFDEFLEEIIRLQEDSIQPSEK